MPCSCVLGDMDLCVIAQVCDKSTCDANDLCGLHSPVGCFKV